MPSKDSETPKDESKQEEASKPKRSFFPFLLCLLLAGALGVGVTIIWTKFVVGSAEVPEFFFAMGRLHQAIVHLPIGFLLLVFLMEFSKSARPAAGMAMGLTAIFSVAAVFSGLVLFLEDGGDVTGVLQKHLWVGITVASTSILAFFLISLSSKGMVRWLYRFVLFLAVSAGAVAGHLGGTMTYGAKYTTEKLPVSVQKILAKTPEPIAKFIELEIELEEVSVPSTSPDEPEKTPEDTFESKVVYHEFVEPVLSTYCVSCHKPSKKKADLLLDTYENLMAGGESGKAVEPGDPENSFLIEVLKLPLDDDLHMPPENKKQPSENEIKILEWWVQTGASKVKTMGELAPDQTMVEILRSSKEKSSKPETSASINMRGIRIVPVEEGSDELEVSCLANSDFDDQALRQLEPVRSSIKTLNLAGTQVTSASLEFISNMPHLTHLQLQNTKISDASLERLGKLHQLEVLNVYGNRGITKKGLEKNRQAKKH